MLKNSKFCIAGAAWLLLLLSGCKPQAETQILAIDDTPKQEEQAELPTYKNKKDSCPRLVQKKVDSTQVLRQDSMTGKSCDYFIYPYIGDTVQASVSDSRISLTLVRPNWHDFANGSYQVSDNGRHVIRLQYDAFGSKPPVMDYVIEIDIQPAVN